MKVKTIFIYNSNIVFWIIAVAYILICAVIILFASKTVINPLKKLISSAKKIAEGQDVEGEIKYLQDASSKTEIGDLAGAFNLMTSGL